jgi:hypothetical protein
MRTDRHDEANSLFFLQFCELAYELKCRRRTVFLFCAPVCRVGCHVKEITKTDGARKCGTEGRYSDLRRRR